MSTIFQHWLRVIQVVFPVVSPPGLCEFWKETLCVTKVRSSQVYRQFFENNNNFSDANCGTSKPKITPRYLVAIAKPLINADLVHQHGVVCKFDVLGDEGGTFFLDLKNGNEKRGMLRA